MNSEIRENFTSFIIYLFGIGMLLIGNQSGVLHDWLFWFPLGLLTLPFVKYGILLLPLHRGKKGESTSTTERRP